MKSLEKLSQPRFKLKISHICIYTILLISLIASGVLLSTYIKLRNGPRIDFFVDLPKEFSHIEHPLNSFEQLLARISGKEALIFTEGVKNIKDHMDKIHGDISIYEIPSSYDPTPLSEFEIEGLIDVEQLKQRLRTDYETLGSRKPTIQPGNSISEIPELELSPTP